MVEVSCLNLEDLKQCKSDGVGMGWGGGGEGAQGKKESATSFIKSLLGASVPPGAESDFWPTMLIRDQRGYQNIWFWWEPLRCLPSSDMFYKPSCSSVTMGT